MSHTFSHGHDELVMECEPIEVTSSLPRQDPEWKHTDQQGHEHDAKRALLIMVKDDPEDPDVYVDPDGDEHNAPTHLECSLCGEWIEPDLIGPSPWREYIQGPKRYYLNGEPITQKQAEELMQQWRSNRM